MPHLMSMPNNAKRICTSLMCIKRIKFSCPYPCPRTSCMHHTNPKISRIHRPTGLRETDPCISSPTDQNSWSLCRCGLVRVQGHRRIGSRENWTIGWKPHVMIKITDFCTVNLSKSSFSVDPVTVDIFCPFSFLKMSTAAEQWPTKSSCVHIKIVGIAGYSSPQSSEITRFEPAHLDHSSLWDTRPASLSRKKTPRLLSKLPVGWFLLVRVSIPGRSLPNGCLCHNPSTSWWSQAIGYPTV